MARLCSANKLQVRDSITRLCLTFGTKPKFKIGGLIFGKSSFPPIFFQMATSATNPKASYSPAMVPSKTELKSEAWPEPPCPDDTLSAAACKILLTANPWLKAEYGAKAASLWKNGLIKNIFDESNSSSEIPPNHPARDETVQVVLARDVKKRGKGGTLQSRQAILHSLVHIESWAVDLSWDIIARFGKSENMPKEFFDDFVQVAEDEGRHFMILEKRLKEIGSSYGSFTAHEGLWDSAMETSSSLSARLAVEHCVHEGRGLDVMPTTISRFRSNGDNVSAELFESIIYPEEITHCAAGVKWFTYLCLRNSNFDITTIEEIVGMKNNSKISNGSNDTKVVYNDEMKKMVIDSFHEIVRKHFKGRLKPPFNHEARAKAGFELVWYEPISYKAKT